MACQNLLRPIQLFGQQPARQQMRPGHLAQRQYQVGAINHCRIKAIGATDRERKISGSFVPDLTDPFGEFATRQAAASLGEGDKTGMTGEGREKFAALVRPLRGPSQPLAGFDFAKDNRPSKAANIVFMQLPKQPGSGMAN